MVDTLHPTPSSPPLDVHLQEHLDEAGKAILNRPRISIRLRFVVSLVFCFLFCSVLTLIALGLLGKVRSRLKILDAAEQLSTQIQKMRVFENNYLQSGSDLDQTLESVETVKALLESEASTLQNSVLSATLPSLSHDLTMYRMALDNCTALSRHPSGDVPPRELFGVDLKTHGDGVSSKMRDLIKAERNSVDGLLRTSARIPLGLTFALLLLFLLITYFFSRALMDPIHRFHSYTQRIAAGDFRLIHPARFYRDEFSDLALAINRMLAEIQFDQEQCVRAGKMAAIGTLTSGIAHELNNPINNIYITTETLMEELKTLNDEQKFNLLEDIYFETERAGEIVRSLLDFTRDDKATMGPVELHDLIQATFRLVQNEIVLNDIAVEDAIPKNRYWVQGVANQLRQLFLNLFLNAIQAMPEGGTLSVSTEDRDKNELCILVRDQGAGISPDDLPHIFDPFFTTKEPGKGTGLGLSMCYSIVRKHAGDIQATSKPGKGTTFRVCLPLAEVPHS